MKKDPITPKIFLIFITKKPILGPGAPRCYRTMPMENDNWKCGWWRDTVESCCNTGWDLEAWCNAVHSHWLTGN